VRFIGMSGTLPHLTDHIAMGVFDVFQIPYSAVEREHETAIASAALKGAGIVIRGGAAKGAPTEGKQAGLQWERWRQARLDDLLDGMTLWSSFYASHSPTPTLIRVGCLAGWASAHAGMAMQLS
jgi:hypothetical protein